MRILTTALELDTRGDCHVVDVTAAVGRLLAEHGFEEGSVTLFCPGSTGGLSTIEYEPGLLADLPALLDRLIPPGRYEHDRTWGDGNGHAHLRATLFGPSLVVPFQQGRLLLGTWQQIIFMDFDNRPRRRSLVVQLHGRP